MTVLCVVGLRAEGRLVSGAVVCAGGDPVQLAEALRGIDRGGLRGVLSFGIAGGLAPGLAAGALVVASAVHLADGSGWDADPAWAARLGTVGARLGVVAGADAVVADAAAKRALREATGALCVDLESAVAADYAMRHGLPFAALRAVADTADEVLPRAAAVGLRPDGAPDVPAVLRALAAHPRELPALIRVALRSRSALGALRRAVGLLGGDLGLSRR